MSLQNEVRRADIDGNSARASALRNALAEFDRRAAENLLTLTETHAQAGPSSARQPQQAPATTVPTIDWCTAYRQLLGIRSYFEHASQYDDAQQFLASMRRMDGQVRRRFEIHGGKREDLLPIRSGHLTRPEQMYRFLEDSARRAEPASGARKPSKIHRAMQILNENARKELSSLTRMYGSLEDLAAQAGLTQQQAPVTVAPTPTSATAQATVAPPLQPVDPVPAPGSVPAPPPPAPRRPVTATVELPSVTNLYSEPPGPSSRFMPTRAPRSPMVPVREAPLAQRQAIVEHFRSGEALLHAGFTLGNGGANTLGWAAARESAVLDDLHRLHTSAAKDPRAAAALADIDWSGIEALTDMMDLPSLSP